MAVPTAESGHQTGRVYTDSLGNLHANGAALVGVNDDHLYPDYEYLNTNLGAFATSAPVFTIPNDGASWFLKAASVRFTVASSSGTMQIEAAGAAIAVGSGTNQLTGAMSLSSTANTTVNGTVIASPTSLPAGTSVNAIAGGTLTSLANCVLTLVFSRQS